MATTETKTYFLLDGRQANSPGEGWRTKESHNLVIDREGISLLPLPAPAVPLKDSFGTFGGLENPTGVAVDREGNIYVSDKDRDLIYRVRFCGDLEPVIEFVPCLGGSGPCPRQFDEPRGLAVSPRGDLYVADSRNNRVQVFGLRGLVLKNIWPNFKEPWDVAVNPQGDVFVADKGNHRVVRFDHRTGKFQSITGEALHVRVFQVRYGTSERRRFAFIQARTRLEQWPDVFYPLPGSASDVIVVSESVDSVDEARELVLKTIGGMGARNILFEWETAYPFALQGEDAEPPFESPTHLAVDSLGSIYVVDEQKEFVKVMDHNGRVLDHITYLDDAGGPFKPTAVALDANGNLLVGAASAVHRFAPSRGRLKYDRPYCTLKYPTGLALTPQGDVVAVGGDHGPVAQIPESPGFLKQGTWYSGVLDSEMESCQWHQVAVDFAGGGVPEAASAQLWTFASDDADAIPGDDDWLTGQSNANDFLVLSPPGRYLRLKIEFKGNGVSTPVLAGIRLHFPRQTSLQYLPAVYQADSVSKDFLERFLSIFDAGFASFEKTIDDLARHFDAYGTPIEFLEWLASWVAMPFHKTWPEATRRRLLNEAANLYKTRGTLAGLQRMIRLATGIDAQILEHFKMRRWAFLNTRATLGDRSTLWGGCEIPRLQLDENSRIGEFALIGTQDPERDAFHLHAHQFTVFVPAAKCREPLDESILRQIIDADKPAHTEYTLNKVEARLRVGMQAMVGLDTMVGGYPHIVLNHCSTLGYDTLLNCDPEDDRSMMRISRHSRVGVDAVVG